MYSSCREPAIFEDTTRPASENKELLEVIERTFKQLDDEIAEAALASDIKECQFGGTTALMALISGRVSTACPLTSLLDVSVFCEHGCKSSRIVSLFS